MVQFAVPVVFVFTKMAVRRKVDNAIKCGIGEASCEVEKTMKKSLVSTFLNISINIVLLTIAIYVSPFLLGHKSVVFLICSIYLSSVLYAVGSMLRSLPMAYRIVLVHRLNLRKFIEYEIFRESYCRASAEIENQNILSKTLNKFFGKSAEEIAKTISTRSADNVFKKVVANTFLVIAVSGVYALIFRVMVAPVMIKDATDLTLPQAAIYPVLLTVDYFFGTNLINFVGQVGFSCFLI